MDRSPRLRAERRAAGSSVQELPYFPKIDARREEVVLALRTLVGCFGGGVLGADAGADEADDGALALTRDVDGALQQLDAFFVGRCRGCERRRFTFRSLAELAPLDLALLGFQSRLCDTARRRC